MSSPLAKRRRVNKGYEDEWKGHKAPTTELMYVLLYIFFQDECRGTNDLRKHFQRNVHPDWLKEMPEIDYFIYQNALECDTEILMNVKAWRKYEERHGRLEYPDTKDIVELLKASKVPIPSLLIPKYIDRLVRYLVIAKCHPKRFVIDAECRNHWSLAEDTKELDSSVTRCQDFFEYFNGTTTCRRSSMQSLLLSSHPKRCIARPPGPEFVREVNSLDADGLFWLFHDAFDYECFNITGKHGWHEVTHKVVPEPVSTTVDTCCDAISLDDSALDERSFSDSIPNHSSGNGSGEGTPVSDDFDEASSRSRPTLPSDFSPPPTARDHCQHDATDPTFPPAIVPQELHESTELPEISDEGSSLSQTPDSADNDSGERSPVSDDLDETSSSSRPTSPSDLARVPWSPDGSRNESPEQTSTPSFLSSPEPNELTVVEVSDESGTQPITPDNEGFPVPDESNDGELPDHIAGEEVGAMEPVVDYIVKKLDGTLFFSNGGGEMSDDGSNTMIAKGLKNMDLVDAETTSNESMELEISDESGTRPLPPVNGGNYSGDSTHHVLDVLVEPSSSCHVSPSDLALPPSAMDLCQQDDAEQMSTPALGSHVMNESMVMEMDLCQQDDAEQTSTPALGSHVLNDSMVMEIWDDRGSQPIPPDDDGFPVLNDPEDDELFDELARLVVEYIGRKLDGRLFYADGGDTYGEISDDSIIKIANELEDLDLLGPNEIFCDCGAGTNRIAMCMAQLLNCLSLGIEVVPKRYMSAVEQNLVLLKEQADFDDPPTIRLSNLNVAYVCRDATLYTDFGPVTIFYMFDEAFPEDLLPIIVETCTRTPSIKVLITFKPSKRSGLHGIFERNGWECIRSLPVSKKYRRERNTVYFYTRVDDTAGCALADCAAGAAELGTCGEGGRGEDDTAGSAIAEGAAGAAELVTDGDEFGGEDGMQTGQGSAVPHDLQRSLSGDRLECFFHAADISRLQAQYVALLKHATVLSLAQTRSQTRLRPMPKVSRPCLHPPNGHLGNVLFVGVTFSEFRKRYWRRKNDTDMYPHLDGYDTYQQAKENLATIMKTSEDERCRRDTFRCLWIEKKGQRVFTHAEDSFDRDPRIDSFIPHLRSERFPRYVEMYAGYGGFRQIALDDVWTPADYLNEALAIVLRLHESLLEGGVVYLPYKIEVIRSLVQDASSLQERFWIDVLTNEECEGDHLLYSSMAEIRRDDGYVFDSMGKQPIHEDSSCGISDEEIRKFQKDFKSFWKSFVPPNRTKKRWVRLTKYS